MAFLSVTEFQSVIWAGVSGHQLIPAPYTPSKVEQSIAISGATASSSVFGTTTRFIQVHTDVNCVLSFVGVPTQGFHRLGQNETRYYGVDAGGVISVMSSAT